MEEQPHKDSDGTEAGRDEDKRRRLSPRIGSRLRLVPIVTYPFAVFGALDLERTMSGEGIVAITLEPRGVRCPVLPGCRTRGIEIASQPRVGLLECFETIERPAARRLDRGRNPPATEIQKRAVTG